MATLTPHSDPSPLMHDPGTQAPGDYQYRSALNEYFLEGDGSHIEKLENFAKYVPRQSLARMLARYEIFRLIYEVQGSIVECGVMFGGGLMAFANLSVILEPYNFQRRVIGFDTFEGFPEISKEDLQGAAGKSRHLHVSGFARQAAFDDLRRSIEVFDLNRPLNHFPKVELVKGDFNVTVAQYIENYPHLIISCLYLDFDIYGPTRTAIEYLYPRIPKGGVIVFDELNEPTFPGETTAVIEGIGIHNLRVRRFPFEPRISYAVVGD